MVNYIEKDTDIGELVRKAEEDFTSGSTTISKYVQRSLKEDIERIYAYLESKHTSGETDSQGREKPFFNIVLAARNIWFRATDIDRSNIKIRPTKSQDDVGAFLATVHLRDWMRRENFGTFLNAWGINSAGFNETILKFVEQDGRLVPSVVPWSKIICDGIDFVNNPKIEIIELTKAQLRKRKGYDKDIVNKLCDALAARETLDKEKRDNKDDYIKLYEVHGELPLSYLTGNPEDADEYVQQMHVISFLVTKETGEHDDFTLYSGRESKDPYMLTALLPEIDGSIALRGSVKTLFDVQWMQNHTAKTVKDQLDLASLLIFQTSDPTFVGQNALSAIQNGDILVHKTNEPLTMLNNKADISAQQAYGQQWKALGNEIAGISEQMLGVAPKSGTAWRQTESLLQESHSLFELMTENRGLAIEQALREHVIPFLKKKMDTTKEVATTLEAHEMTKLDARYVKNSSIQKANAYIKEKLLNGEDVTPEEQALFTAGYAQEAQSGLQQQGNQRFFKPSDLDDATWKNVFKDLEWDVEVDVTNENLDANALETLNNLLQIVADPARSAGLQTPNGKLVFNKILQLTGAVSPAELADVPPPEPQAPENKVSRSINFKDLPFEGQQQLAAQADIEITQPPEVEGEELQAKEKQNA
jgi:hypothetical protein